MLAVMARLELGAAEAMARLESPSLPHSLGAAAMAELELGGTPPSGHGEASRAGYRRSSSLSLSPATPPWPLLLGLLAAPLPPRRHGLGWAPSPSPPGGPSSPAPLFPGAAQRALWERGRAPLLPPLRPRGRARRGGAAAAAVAAMGERGRDAREQRTEAGPTPRRW